MTKTRRFASQVIHAGQAVEPVTGAVIPPIFTTSTYAQPQPGAPSDYVYSRCQNPTREALESMLVALEGGVGALAFSSGMAAITSVLDLLSPHDHIIVNEDVYGGTWRLFEKVKRQSMGLSYSFVDMRNLDAVAAAIQPNTKMLWLETPSNPLLRVLDIAACANLAKDYNLLTVVDNTFATPYLQQPLLSGADIVVHSVTKYLNGHSDVLGGALVTADPEHHERLAFIQKSTGAVMSPFDAFLALRGIKTLALRMERHCANAQRIAELLMSHPRLERVWYPGLTSHPDHLVAKQQMTAGFGGMVTIQLVGGQPEVEAFLQSLELFTVAESLGGVESLIEQPYTMTHASLSDSHKRALGITPGCIRLSVGIEDPHDLEADLLSALR